MLGRFKDILFFALGAFAVGALLTRLELPLLRRLHAGQSIREEGPQAHLKKSGTPTMGGIAIIITAFTAMGIASVSSGNYVFRDAMIVALFMLLFGLIGFLDDFIKVIKKRNLGLRAWQKMALQLIFSLFLAAYGYSKHPEIFVPFINTRISFGVFYIPFVIFMTLAMTNAVNLTDGLDGLASSVTAIVAAAFAFISPYLAGTIAGSIICGACLGFFHYNKHPAKLFMGDTGSLALGGGLAALAVIQGTELFLPIAGGIYVAEALSVIIQVFVFKTQNGRRFFRMAPLHHHFELGGWKETKVVLVFDAVTLGLCLITVLLGFPLTM